MKIQPKVWNTPGSTLTISRAELVAFGLAEEDIKRGEVRGALKTFGPWQIPVSYRALCMSVVWTPEDRTFTAQRDSETCYGVRTLSSVRQSGSCLEGRVSVNGRSVRGFTSSQLFELEDGGLVSIATIHACL